MSRYHQEQEKKFLEQGNKLIGELIQLKKQYGKRVFGYAINKLVYEAEE